MGGRAVCSGSPGVHSAELGNLACTFYPVTPRPPPSTTPASVSRVVSCLSVLPSCRSLRHSEYSHAEGTQSPWGTFFFKIMSSEQCGCNLFLLFGLTEYMPLFSAAPQELTEPVLSILIYSTGAGGECSEGSHDLTAGDTQPTCSPAST